MKVIYDPATDIMRIVFREAIVEDYSEDRPGVKVDYDLEDKIIALEIQNASQIVEDPRSLEHLILD
ncbi:MAG: DUF2283 domain-containing protein [Synechococcales cyanobacterium C42_A2020_086]|jgi:uncharacterized protein YuzE|nr:DUF2283 domain-containing protein [Synechococcales cyanobacterium M58_A2018_015]MBF2075240.1 DUF2283 domain-containing protein [Synechococcales cyanobacterium C42_A2020_086]